MLSHAGLSVESGDADDTAAVEQPEASDRDRPSRPLAAGSSRRRRPPAGTRHGSTGLRVRTWRRCTGTAAPRPRRRWVGGGGGQLPRAYRPADVLEDEQLPLRIQLQGVGAAYLTQ